ncbi:MAG: hypothetical protein Kow00127_11270 [Bacteroidales bacterium]
MIRKFFLLILMAGLFAACNQPQQPATEETTEVSAVNAEIPVLTVAEFDSLAPEYVGKVVTVNGLVNHTCKHGGKRMFLVDEGTDASVKVEAGENVAAFDAEMEGSEVTVTGVVTETVIDAAYLDEWEQEVLAEGGEEMKIHDGDHKAEGEETEAEENMRKIENLRKMLAESGKDHLSFYAIEASEYSVVPPAAAADTSGEE